MATDKDILAIFAKHVNWHDEGDRQTVADFLGRNPDANDPFGPETDENRASREQTDDGYGDDDDEKNNESTASDKTPAPAKTGVKATPATVRR